MNWSKPALVVMTMALVAGAAPLASGGTPEEDECCDVMETQALQKYYLKHYKKAGRCTYKMDLKQTDLKCDDGYDANTGGLDFLIDKLQEKSLAKMERKCRKYLGFAKGTVASEPTIADCSCPSETSLWNQMKCILELTQDDVDNAVCSSSPGQMNANRGLSPPGTTAFCP